MMIQKQFYLYHCFECGFTYYSPNWSYHQQHPVLPKMTLRAGEDISLQEPTAHLMEFVGVIYDEKFLKHVTQEHPLLNRWT